MIECGEVIHYVYGNTYPQPGKYVTKMSTIDHIIQDHQNSNPLLSATSECCWSTSWHATFMIIFSKLFSSDLYTALSQVDNVPALTVGKTQKRNTSIPNPF